MKSIVDYWVIDSRIGILNDQNPKFHFLALFRSVIALHLD